MRALRVAALLGVARAYICPVKNSVPHEASGDSSADDWYDADKDATNESPLVHFNVGDVDAPTWNQAAHRAVTTGDMDGARPRPGRARARARDASIAGDGSVDVIAISEISSASKLRLTVFLNDGSPSAPSFVGTTIRDGTICDDYSSVAVLDADGDEDLDILVGCVEHVVLYTQEAGGVAERFTKSEPFETGWGDFDGAAGVALAVGKADVAGAPGVDQVVVVTGGPPPDGERAGSLGLHCQNTNIAYSNSKN